VEASAEEGLEINTEKLLADSQQNSHDKNLLRVYSTEILLMMDSGLIRNM
jgi:hypothetical protein